MEFFHFFSKKPSLQQNSQEFFLQCFRSTEYSPFVSVLIKMKSTNFCPTNDFWSAHNVNSSKKSKNLLNNQIRFLIHCRLSNLIKILISTLLLEQSYWFIIIRASHRNIARAKRHSNAIANDFPRSSKLAFATTIHRISFISVAFVNSVSVKTIPWLFLFFFPGIRVLMDRKCQNVKQLFLIFNIQSCFSS